jgi:hypothetical protein
MIVKVKNFLLQFDWGTCVLIAEATGKDAANPLEGINSLSEQALYVLYGGISRKQQADKQPITYTVDMAKEDILLLRPATVGRFISEFGKTLSVDAEEDDEKKSQEIK